MKTISRIATVVTLALVTGVTTIGTAHAQWSVTGKNLPSGLLESIPQTETLLADAGVPVAFTDTTATIHYLGGGGGSDDFPAGNVGTNPFPTGAGTGGIEMNGGQISSIGNNFGFAATSTVTVVGAPSADVFFYATTDDGFKLELIRGGVTSLIFGNTGFQFDTNLITATPVNVQTGDILRFVYFERAGGEFAYLYQDTDGDLSTTTDRTLVTSTPGSGVVFNAAPVVIPEAGSLALLLPALGLVATGAIARRRK